MQTFAKFRWQLYLLTTTCLVAWHCSRTLLTLTSLAHEPVTASINTSTVLIPLYHHITILLLWARLSTHYWGPHWPPLTMALSPTLSDHVWHCVPWLLAATIHLWHMQTIRCPCPYSIFKSKYWLMLKYKCKCFCVMSVVSIPQSANTSPILYYSLSLCQSKAWRAISFEKT